MQIITLLVIIFFVVKFVLKLQNPESQNKEDESNYKHNINERENKIKETVEDRLEKEFKKIEYGLIDENSEEIKIDISKQNEFNIKIEHYISNRNYNKASMYCFNSILLDPYNELYLYLLNALFKKDNKSEIVLNFYEYFEVHFPKVPVFYNLRSQVHFDLGDKRKYHDDIKKYQELLDGRKEELKEKDSKKIINILSLVIKLDKKNKFVFKERARAYLTLKAYKLSLEDYRNAINLDVKDASTFYERGQCFFNLGEIENAIKDYSNAIKIDPGNENYYFDRGECYKKTKEINLAIKDFSKLLSIDPQDEEAYILRAECFELLKKDYEASLDYHHLLQLLDKNSDKYKNIEIKYNALKELMNNEKDEEIKVKDIIEIIEEKIEEDIQDNEEIKDNEDELTYEEFLNQKFSLDEDVNNEISEERNYEINEEFDLELDNKINEDINNYQRSLDKMKEDFEKRIDESEEYKKLFSKELKTEEKVFKNDLEKLNFDIEIHPYDKVGFINRGNYYYENKKFDNAIDDYSKVLMLNTLNDDLYFKRSKCYLELNKFEEAIKDISKALTYNYNNAEYYFCRAKLYEKNKNYNDAVRDYKKSIDLGYEDKLFDERIFCYEKIGNYNEMIRIYNEMIIAGHDEEKLCIKKGNLFSKLGREDKKIDEYIKAALLGNVDAVYWLNAKKIEIK